MSTLIEIKHLKKFFDTPSGILHAVDDVSFAIEKGTVLGIVGESGCGKSTLGKTILGLHKPTDGHIFYDGEDITRPNNTKRTELRKKMQIIFQDPYSSLDPRMPVWRLIADPLIANKIYRKKVDLVERVRQLMETVGLDLRLAYAYPHELDGGRRQRIGIARALALDPEFILCDEPVSALDVSIQAQILNLLQDLRDKKGLTYIFVTHNLSVVKHISDEILVMYVGCMVEKCSNDDLFDHPLHPYSKGLLSAIPIPSIDIERTETLLEGELTSPVNPKQECRFASRCPHATDLCRNTLPQFTEVLPKHFVACHHVRKINNLN